MSGTSLWSSKLSPFAKKPVSKIFDKNPHLQSVSVRACIAEPIKSLQINGISLGDFFYQPQILLLRHSRAHPEHPHMWTLPTANVESGTLLEAVIRAVDECANMHVKEITQFLGWHEDTDTQSRVYYFLVHTVEASEPRFAASHWALPTDYYYASFFNYHRTMDNYGGCSDWYVPTFVSHAMSNLENKRSLTKYYKNKSRVVFVNGEWREPEQRLSIGFH